MQSEMQYKRLDIDAKRNWDNYYKSNTVNGYKDRHYIHREFEELTQSLEESSAITTLIDLGCGVGNAFYPLLAMFQTNL